MARWTARETSWRIRGGAPLRGEVQVAGAKNAALPIMAASLLADGPVRLTGIPEVADVATLASVLRSVGCLVETHGDELRLCAEDDAAVCADPRMVRRMRASFCVLGPLLARRGRAVAPLPGGCRIGPRPVDIHLRGLQALGADLRIERGCVVAEARRLRGAIIDMTGPLGPTVTGTANVLSAAVLAHGETVLRGAAREPEIVDLGRFLIRLGADIAGLGTSTIEVHGVPRLAQRPASAYRVIPDRIEAATWLMAAAITRGDVTVAGAAPEHLGAVIERLRDAGADVDCGADWIRLACPRDLSSMDFIAAPYPATPTDVQPLWAALMTQASGGALIRDRVFPGRFGYLDELARLGAHFVLDRQGITILGPRPLRGCEVRASDLRGGAALLLAALAAEGETVLHGTHHLARGYGQWPSRLASLGAHVTAPTWVGFERSAISSGATNSQPGLP